MYSVFVSSTVVDKIDEALAHTENNVDVAARVSLHLSSHVYYCIHNTGPLLHVLVKVPVRVLYGNYWAWEKFEKVM